VGHRARAEIAARLQMSLSWRPSIEGQPASTDTDPATARGLCVHGGAQVEAGPVIRADGHRGRPEWCHRR